MKTKMVVLVLATVLIAAGFQQALARGWGDGRGAGVYQGMGCAGACSGQYQQLDEETQNKLQAFRLETLELRKQMAMKRAEKQALLRAQTPDFKAVAQVEGVLFELRHEMQQKALEAGVPMMMGMGRMGGKGHHAKRMMPCGNQARWN